VLGVGIALMLDQGELAQARIGLAQTHPVALRQPHQLLARPVQKLRIGGERHVLGLHRGVDDHPRQLGGLDCLGPDGNRQAFLDQRLQPFLAHAVAPARQRRAIEHQPMLEELLAAEELVIGILDPTLAQHLVGEIVGVLEDRQPRHQSRRQWRAPRIIRVDGPKLTFQELPIHRVPQRHQRMLQVDDLIEPRAKQILLSRLPSFRWPHLVPRQNIQRRVNHKSILQGIPSRTPDSRQTQLSQTAASRF
jgi:hypothetical protein